MEHKWQMDGDEIDEMAWDVEDGYGGGHNGPKCEICEFSPCKFCMKVSDKDPYNAEMFPCPGPPEEGKFWYFRTLYKGLYK